MGTEKERILLGYLLNELSDIEQRKIEEWINEDPDHEQEVKLLAEIWQTPSTYPTIVNIEDEQKKLWSRLHREYEYSPNARENKFLVARNIFRYAAAITLLLGLGYIFWDNMQTEVPKTPVLVETIERVNPLGQKSRIQLPDGSNVWLNADSKLSYSSDFGVSARELQLEGEAYFEVAEDPAKPFKVYTDNLVITVLGTSFNICAYEGQLIEKIALKTGKVKIQYLTKLGTSFVPSFLKPGELASFDVNSNIIDISKYGRIDPYGWKDGRIVFNNATFDEVIEALSRWYNVEFHVTGTLKQEWSYGSTFENEILVNVLESLKFSEKIEYELNGSVVKLTL